MNENDSQQIMRIEARRQEMLLVSRAFVKKLRQLHADNHRLRRARSRLFQEHLRLRKIYSSRLGTVDRVSAADATADDAEQS